MPLQFPKPCLLFDYYTLIDVYFFTGLGSQWTCLFTWHAPSNTHETTNQSVLLSLYPTPLQTKIWRYSHTRLYYRVSYSWDMFFLCDHPVEMKCLGGYVPVLGGTAPSR